MNKQLGQDSTDDYQERARELRERASRSGDPEYKSLLVRAADFYENMAAGLILPLGV